MKMAISDMKLMAFYLLFICLGGILGVFCLRLGAEREVYQVSFLRIEEVL
jgi:hypothetical protein